MKGVNEFSASSANINWCGALVIGRGNLNWGVGSCGGQPGQFWKIIWLDLSVEASGHFHLHQDILTLLCFVLSIFEFVAPGHL